MSRETEQLAAIPPDVLEQAARDILRRRADDALSNLKTACGRAESALGGTYYAKEREIVARAENSITLLRSALDDLAAARKLSPLVESVEVRP